jgi:glycosyltransferase involved in cell wall biosynthesis
MRILMLSGAYPIPTDNGAKRRILATASHLSQRHDLTLVSLREHYPSAMLHTETDEVTWQDHVVDLPVKSRLQTALKACFSRHSYGQVKYWNRDLQSVVAGMLTTQHFDCIWVHFLLMAIYIEQCFLKNQSGQKQSLPLFVLDQHNVDELYFRSFLTSKANTAWKLYAALEVLKARHLQKRWFPRFDAILCVAPEDLQKTAQYVDTHTGLWLAPNGVDIEYFQPIAQQNLRERTSILVFGGSLDVTMNQDAVLWFSASMLPSIKQRVPDAQFWIVGRNPTSEVRSLAERQGIKITGTVADVRDYYRQAAVFVVPLRIGGGTKLKTLEAMAMGLPIVSTVVGAQGLDVESGRHLYIADSPEDFTARAVELLKDRDKAVSMGTEARRLVEQKYSWTGIMGDVDRKLTNLFCKRESQRG